MTVSTWQGASQYGTREPMLPEISSFITWGMSKMAGISRRKFGMHFLNTIQMSLKFVAEGAIDHSSLVQAMTRHWELVRALPELMISMFLTSYGRNESNNNKIYTGEMYYSYIFMYISGQWNGLRTVMPWLPWRWCWQIEDEQTWTPFCRRHFQIHFSWSQTVVFWFNFQWS